MTAQQAEMLPMPTQEQSLTVVLDKAIEKGIDPDSLSKLMDLHERWQAQQAKSAYAVALAALQAELPTITAKGEIKDNKGKVISKYGKWEHINKAITPILKKHGFSLSTRTGKPEEGLIPTTAILTHSGGHNEENTVWLPLDKSGYKNDIQSAGSTLSYGIRYAARGLLNFTVEGEDNDGVGAYERISEKQVADLEALIEDVGADRNNFLKFCKLDKLEDMNVNAYSGAVNALEQKRKQK